jgi:hypothetical protein
MRSTLIAAIGALAVTVAATAADARCTRLAFSVNDYGKDGPTKDAKDLLDKHVAKWAADNGIKKYTTGKKTVSCELYLDLILFDEHTCKAEASVCWEGGPAAAPDAGATPAAAAPKKATSAPAAPAPKTKATAQGQ